MSAEAQGVLMNDTEIWITAKYIYHHGTIENLDRYEVSNLGKVRNMRTKKVLGLCVKPGRGYTKEVHDEWYKYVSIFRNCSKKKPFRLGRLVLSSFNPEGHFPNAQTDHIDHVKTNDRLDNLQWVTQQENQKNQIKHNETKETKMHNTRM